MTLPFQGVLGVCEPSAGPRVERERKRTLSALRRALREASATIVSEGVFCAASTAQMAIFKDAMTASRFFGFPEFSPMVWGKQLRGKS